MAETYKVPEKKFDGKWFKARRWSMSKTTAREWAESYRKAGYLARVTKGAVLMRGVESQWPEGLGGRPVERRVIVEHQVWIVYLRRP